MESDAALLVSGEGERLRMTTLRYVRVLSRGSVGNVVETISPGTEVDSAAEDIQAVPLWVWEGVRREERMRERR